MMRDGKEGAGEGKRLTDLGEEKKRSKAVRAAPQSATAIHSPSSHRPPGLG